MVSLRLLIVSVLFQSCVGGDRIFEVEREKAEISATKCAEKCLCSDDRQTVICKGITEGEFVTVTGKFPDIRTLTVEDSALGYLRNETFKHCASVKVLDLIRSRVSSIPEGAMDHMKDLQQLKLSHNQIGILGEPVSFLDWNFARDISYIPGFTHAKYLRKVDLSNNNIKSVAIKTMYGMKYVGYLDMSGNNIQSMGKPFNYLMGIKVLDLSFNRIVDIDENFGRMQLVMEELNFSHNYIKEMPFHSTQCTKLATANLGFNEFTSISSIGVTNCETLENLNLENNKIGAIRRSDFKKNPDLRFLNLASNRIEIVEDDAFISCGKLEELHIDNNFIQFISNKTMKGLGSLKILNVASNRIQRINGSVFVENVWLKYIYLQNNRIRYIHPQTFRCLALLSIVDLRKNLLSVPNHEWFLTVSGEFYFDPFSEVVSEKIRASFATFKLDGNVWSCDCKTLDFHKWSLTQKVMETRLLPKIQCYYPGFHRGKYMMQLQEDEFICGIINYFKLFVSFNIITFTSIFMSLFAVIFIYLCRRNAPKREFHVL